MRMNFIKNFWVKLTLPTKLILIVCTIFIAISALGTITYKPVDQEQIVDNSDIINRITNRNNTPASFPISYTSNWNGVISLFPKNNKQLELAYSNTKECFDITEGMAVYYTKDLASLMVINNKNLLKTSLERSNFNEDKDIILGVKNFFSQNIELRSFKTYCNFFAAYLIDEVLNINFNNSDATRSVLGLGTRSAKLDNISKIGLFIYVYSVKDDYLIQLSRSLPGNFIFSDSNWEECKQKNSIDEENKCLKDTYLYDPSMQSKIKTEVDNLMDLFEINYGR